MSELSKEDEAIVEKLTDEYVRRWLDKMKSKGVYLSEKSIEKYRKGVRLMAYLKVLKEREKVA